MISKTLALLLIVSVIVLAGCSSGNTPSYASGNTQQDNSPQGGVQSSSGSQPAITQTTLNQYPATQNTTTTISNQTSHNTNSYTDIETSKDDFNLIDEALNYT